MEYRDLGKTDLKTSILGFGCNRIATMSADAREVEATLLEACNQGINFFDTADCYNQGDSERVLGSVFQGKRDRILICSKAGMTLGMLQRWRPTIVPFVKRVMKRWKPTQSVAMTVGGRFHGQNFQPAYIEKAITASLRRLRTDYLDLFFLHCPPIGAISDTLLGSLEKLRDEGKIRYYGISCSDHVTSDEIELYLEQPGLTALQIPVNLMNARLIEAFRARAQEKGIGLVSRAPFAGGNLFADGEILDNLADISERSPAQAAICFSIQLNSDGMVLVGMTNRKHLAENLEALNMPPLSTEQIDEMKRLPFLKEREVLEEP